MIGETLLPRAELHKWWEIETSIGRKQSYAQKSIRSLYSLFDSFTAEDKEFLFNLIHTDKYWTNKPQVLDKTLLRLTLIKKFIESNRLNVIKEYLYLTPLGRKLEVEIFLRI